MTSDSPSVNPEPKLETQLLSPSKTSTKAQHIERNAKRLRSIMDQLIDNALQI